MVTEMMKDIYRIEIPLPKNPLKLLNSYLIRGNERNLLIDTGFNRPECREALMAGLSEIGIDFDKTDLFLTHFHADHSGLLFSLKTDRNRVYAHEKDARVINMLHKDEYWEYIYSLFHRAGLKMDREEALGTHPGVVWKPEGRLDFTYVKDGDILEIGDYRFRCIVTPGHTPGHTCLYDEDRQILIAGDMILGDITPNLCPELYMEDPLSEYLASLNRIAELPVKTAFVGHRSILEDVPGRIRSLKAHHAERCREALDVLKTHGPMCSWDAAAHMSWDIRAKDWDSFPPSQKWFAVGEAEAHMIFLNRHGKVRMHCDDDGVRSYEYVDGNIEGLI